MLLLKRISEETLQSRRLLKVNGLSQDMANVYIQGTASSQLAADDPQKTPKMLSKVGDSSTDFD